MIEEGVPLPVPSHWQKAEHEAFLDFARAIESKAIEVGGQVAAKSSQDASLAAAASVLADLDAQGWQVRVIERCVEVVPPTAGRNAVTEKERVRGQELLKRNEQLSSPSVRRFVRKMETPQAHNDSWVSIFNLMRDGRALADAIAQQPEDLAGIIDPYVQVIGPDDRCIHTGLRLLDIWRYFRHTWTNQYTSTPGRTMNILVRDRAAPFHPVIGIASIGSAIVQIRERDEWIGWQPAGVLEEIDSAPTVRWARWLAKRLDDGLSEIHVQDLIEDGLFWPTLWREPTADVVEKLRQEAEARRRDHRRFGRRSDFSSSSSEEDVSWVARAETDLFRSKRCVALADLLEAKRALTPYLEPKPTSAGLRNALEDPQARRAIARLIRKAKAEAVGTEIADLTVCGAVSPYRELIGGKLVGMLAVSPTVVRAYHERYASYASQIASSLAGRPIRRRSNLVFIGTTSLYGSSSSQYNRLRLPGEVLCSASDIRFRELGRSRSFGTSHFSDGSVSALVRVSEQSNSGARVKSIFGEGVNPKLRKVREGLDLLGWPSDVLLQHRRPRIVYGVALASNLCEYLLGLDREPKYLFRSNVSNDVEKISSWWRDRWLERRVQSDSVMASVRTHSLDRPVMHGARVDLPPSQSEQDRDTEALGG